MMAASAREELTALIQRQSDRRMSAGLVAELKEVSEMVKESQLKEIDFRRPGKDPKKRGTCRSLTAAGKEGPESCGEDGGGGKGKEKVDR